MDSKVHLFDLSQLSVQLQGNQQIFRIASDIVDYFPQIDLELGTQIVQRYLIDFYGEGPGRFVVSLLKILLTHKYFSMAVNGTILCLKKLKSLSIGEHIATAFANILRYDLITPVLRLSNNIVAKHYGYVDDVLSICVADQPAIVAFIAALDDAIAPLKWEHSVSSTSQHFLDVQIFVQRSVMCDGFERITFETSMYRKPNFRPHYLAAMSCHPQSHKSGIF